MSFELQFARSRGSWGTRQEENGELQGCHAAELPQQPELLNSGQEYGKEINFFFKPLYFEVFVTAKLISWCKQNIIK